MHGISMTGYMGVSLTAPIGLSRVTVCPAHPEAPRGPHHHLRLALESGISPGLALLLLLPSALCPLLLPGACSFRGWIRSPTPEPGEVYLAISMLVILTLFPMWSIQQTKPSINPSLERSPILSVQPGSVPVGSWSLTGN